MSQALVKFLDNQYIECDGVESKFVTGMFGILITTQCLPQYLISMAVAFAVAFALSALLCGGKKKGSEQA